MAILITMVMNTNAGTRTRTRTRTTTSMNMDTIMTMGIATGTKLTSMIRNTQQSLIAVSRGFELISPRN
jgi:hypothetical protein